MAKHKMGHCGGLENGSSSRWPEMQAPVQVLGAFADPALHDSRLEPRRVSPWALAPEAATAGSQPMHVQQDLSAEFNSAEADSMADQQHRMAQMVQLFQYLESQNISIPTEGDFLEQTMAEIVRQTAGTGPPSHIPQAVAAAWGHAAPNNGATADWATTWGKQAQLPHLQPTLVASPKEAVETPGEKAADQRIEELNRYIRQQAQEYTEGQAEWSRQIAEVRGECLRQLEKARRDKELVEKQARSEILRLQKCLRDLGVKEEALARPTPGEESPRAVAWANGVSMEEYQKVASRCTAAEDRIKELEQYIKDQAAKQMSPGSESTDLRVQQLAAELQAVRYHYQQLVVFWEQGAKRLLQMAEQFLSYMLAQEGVETGRFGKTATKLLVTLGNEGASSENLQKMLKDALKNDKSKSRSKAAKPEEAQAEVANSDGCPSSRGSSPGRAGNLQVVGPNGSENITATQTARVEQFVAQVTSDLRQLIAASRQAASHSLRSFAPGSASPEASPRSFAEVTHSTDHSSAGSPGDKEARLRHLLQSLLPARRQAAQQMLVVERLLSQMDRELRERCLELLGSAELEEEAQAGEEEEAKSRTPLTEEHQRMSLAMLRRAQLCSTEALSEFVQLPHKLKAVFDLSKQLGAEAEMVGRCKA